MNLVLLTTSSCIKCKSLKPKLIDYCKENNINLETIDAMNSIGGKLVSTYGIMQVPTVLVYDSNNEVVKIFTGDFLFESLIKFITEVD